MKILKDPLIHFLVFGLVLFGVNVVLNPSVDPDRVIDVNPQVLSRYIQENAMVFDDDWANEYLNSLDDEGESDLISDYVRTESLYREALARGMEKEDHAIRARLVQKLSFILKSSIEDVEEPTDEEVQEYYLLNKDEFSEPASVTFTHVYYSYSKNGFEGALQMADDALRDLREGQIPFEQAVSFGDAFEFHKDYVEVPLDIVAAHFGQDIAERIYSDQVPLHQWVGPYESLYGAHVILIAERKAGENLAFESVSERVRDEAYQAKLDEAANDKIFEVMSKYRLNITGMEP